MRRVFILLLIFSIFSCGQKKVVYNPEAIKLNDSAVKEAMQSFYDRDSAAKIAVGLLDKATRIDTNYVIAYWNKMGYDEELKRYNDAMHDAKEVVRLSHPSIGMYLRVGGACELAGDTLSACNYFKNGLLLCEKVLDTMNVQNRSYNDVAFAKAVMLMMTGEQKKGNVILKQLYTAADPWQKQMYIQYINKSRKVILDEMMNGTSVTTTTYAKQTK